MSTRLTPKVAVVLVSLHLVGIVRISPESLLNGSKDCVGTTIVQNRSPPVADIMGLGIGTYHRSTGTASFVKDGSLHRTFTRAPQDSGVRAENYALRTVKELVDFSFPYSTDNTSIFFIWWAMSVF